jgi:hypothetical protein
VQLVRGTLRLVGAIDWHVAPSLRSLTLRWADCINLKSAQCPIRRADSNGRCNTIWYKAFFQGGVYEARKRFGLSAEQKIDVWRRWKAGQTLHEIGRAFGEEHSSIRCLVSRYGGIAPAVRRRALLALTLREREEISRGLASGSSMREIAKCLQ